MILIANRIVLMSISVADFAVFLGYGIKGHPGEKASGIIVVTKTVRVDQPLTIPANTRFDSSSGHKFFTTQQNIISESASFLPIGVVAQNAGADANIPAGQTWASPSLGGVSVANPQPFFGGENPVADEPGLYPQRQKNLGPKDVELRRALDVGTALIRSMIGLKEGESVPFDDVRVREAIFLVSMYRLESNLIQERRFSAPSLHASAGEVVKYFRQSLYKPVMQQATDLISHVRKTTRFMPVTNEVQSA